MSDTVLGAAYKITFLRAAYRKMAAARMKKKNCLIPISDSILRRVAERLEHASLAVLFIESQFHAMPPDWCQERFGKPYPPVAVVFGGRCWDRYDEYNERGIRDAT